MNEHIESKSPTGDDDVTAGLSFRNIHYFAAGVTLYGGGAMGAYQYAGKTYDGKNPHVKAYDTCIECHDPHSLEREIADACSECHKASDGLPVANDDDLKDIRMQGSPLDYDGDGKSLDREEPHADDAANTEGMYYELETMAIALYGAMQDYAENVAGTGIVYDSHAYPYFFTDTDGDREPDADEANFGNRFSTWTPNLLRAAYNYQYWQKDPGNFAHNPKYMLQILYDSLESLDSHALVDVPNFENMLRSDTGHFDGQAHAFRRWDRTEDDEFGNEQQVGGIERGEVSGSCVRCHSPGGFDFYATYGIDVTIPQPVGDGLECETCHVGDDFGDPSPKRRYIPEVEFPSGVVIENDADEPDDSFICMSCHKGRESKATVDERIDQGRPTFRNIHYLPAGSTLYGADVGVAYEFDGKSYAGKWGHFGPGASDCVTCHLPQHTFLPEVKDSCNFCHPEAGGDITRIRRNSGGVDTIDYDGNGDATERLKDELAVYGGRVLTAMQDYAEGMSNATVNKFIVYSEHTYPYWMNDLDRDRVTDPEEESRSNSYSSWDAPLARAAFNYQYWKKEPGFWAHNSDYAFQIMYDTIESLGGDTGGLVRPDGPDDE
jgi:hypothetical protein